jgi:P27 family predicted phage terminase small subunit
MTRGRKPDPRRAKRGTGNQPQVGKRKTKVVPQVVEITHVDAMAAGLPAGLPREMFQRAVAELAGRLTDTDLEALRMLAWSVYRHQQAQQHIEEHGLVVDTAFGPKVNPMLKQARDEAQLYLKIADQYALTFTSRLRAGLLQLAGASLMKDLHSGIAEAIVAQITDGKK